MNPALDRIPCINPRCRRTAPVKPGDTPDTEIICRSCWKLLPPELTLRDRELRRSHRKFLRLARQPDKALVAERLARRRAWQIHLNWEQIRAYLVAPPRPEGLDRFLSDMGLDR